MISFPVLGENSFADESLWALRALVRSAFVDPFVEGQRAFSGENLATYSAQVPFVVIILPLFLYHIIHVFLFEVLIQSVEIIKRFLADVARDVDSRSVSRILVS